MKPINNNTTFFLLALYAIVLMHSFIAHDYDGDLFATLFSPLHSRQTEISGQTAKG